MRMARTLVEVRNIVQLYGKTLLLDPCEPSLSISLLFLSLTDCSRCRFRRRCANWSSTSRHTRGGLYARARHQSNLLPAKST